MVDVAEWAFVPDPMSSLSLIDTVDTSIERLVCIREDSPLDAFRGPGTIPGENVIMHDLYTATIRVNLHPDSEMKRGVESSMKSLPSSFKCKTVYVSSLHSNDLSPLKTLQFNFEQYNSLTGIKSSHLQKGRQLACIFSGSQGISTRNDGQVPLVHCLAYVDIMLSQLNSGRLFIVSVPFLAVST